MTSKRIEELKAAIAAESGKVNQRIEELKMQNEKHNIVVHSHSQRYVEAVQDGADDAEIERLTKEYEEALKLAQRNDEIIKILQIDPGSRIQRLRAELVGEYFKVNDEINAKADQLSARLNKLRDELIQGTKELMKLNEQQHMVLYTIDHTPLDEKDIAMYGLEGMSKSEGRRSIAVEDGYRQVESHIHKLQFRPFVDCK